VRSNDLILGVNISLGLQPADACPAFQNAQGEVTIAQLIKGVNNSLGGCTPATTLTPTKTIGVPTAPATATVTATATIGVPTATATATVTATTTIGVPTATATATITATPTATPTSPPGCGDNVVGEGEQCDPVGSSRAAGAVCQHDCPCPCDFLDTSDCLFPFPSDYLTVADPDTDTGRRVHFALDGMPRNVSHTQIAVTEYNRGDGFSVGASILLHVPNVDLAMTGAAPITDIARSLAADAPILLINTATLARHLIWAELDANANSEATRALIIRPGVNLAEGTRYIVALRRMEASSGAIIPPSEDLLAYRDDTETGESFKEARRPHMEEIATTRAAAAIGRSDLYLAWDFTVASERNNTERMLFIRDDA